MKLNKPVLKWTHIMKLTQNWLHCGESRANWPRYTYTYITRLQYKTQKHISLSTSRKEAYFPVLLYFKPWSKCTLTNLYFVQGNCIIYHVCFNRRGNAIDIWTSNRMLFKDQNWIFKLDILYNVNLVIINIILYEVDNHM